MWKIVIRKGMHYPFPFFAVGLPHWVKKNKVNIRTRYVKFTDSCMFDLGDEDQHDVNKLFGFSIGYHHKTSFRFGWRPILSENKIEIVGYEYHDGIRQPTIPIGRVELNKWYKFRLVYLPHLYPQQRTYYEVSNPEGVTLEEMCYMEIKNDFNLKKKSGLGYTLGIYFGGNERAPHKITIFKKKKP